MNSSLMMASTQIGIPILSLLVWLPLLGAALLLAGPRLLPAKSLALALCAVQVGLSLWIVMAFRDDTAALQFAEVMGPYRLGIDGTSLWFLPLTALLCTLAVLAPDKGRSAQREPGYFAALLAFAACMYGAFSAADTLLFVAFFAAEVVPSAYLIARHGTGEQRHASARQYVVVMLAASALVGAGLWLAGAGRATALPDLLAARLPDSAQTLPFLLLLLGLGIKAPLFPLHAWLPRVLEQGPMVGMSVFLVGLKLGTYGMLRFMLPLLPAASAEWLWLAAGLGVCSLVYGALIAFVQTNLRRLLAYASVSHVGVVMLGLFSMNVAGLQGALLQMMSLGLSAAGMFFIASFLESRLGHAQAMSVGGLGRTMPWLAASFLVIGLAGVGMPGTSGFNGEHLIMMGAYKAHWGLALAVGAGTFLGAAYFLRCYQRAFMGEPASTASVVTDLGVQEKLITAAVTIVILWVGLYTTPVLRSITPTLSAIEALVGHSSATPR